MSALQDVFELSVVISAVDKLTGPMKKMMDQMKYNQKNMDMITKSMKSFGASSADIDKVTNSLNKLERNKAWANMAKDLKAAGVAQPEIDKMAQGFDKVTAAQDAASKSFNKFKGITVAGAAITGVGVGIAYAFGKAAEKAGELELAVKGVATAMKLNDQQTKQLSDMSMTLGIPTMFDSVTTSKIIGAMYTAGLSKQQVLDPNIARQYINFADVQAATKHEDPTAAVSDAATMAHAYQLYSTAQLTPFLNNLNAMMMQSHQTLDQFKTQYAYIASQAKKSGLSSDDALTATTWVNRMGIGGGKSGGTSFADFLSRSYFGSSGQKADDAMVAAGLVTGAVLVPAQKVNGKNVAAHYQGGHSVFFDEQGNFIGMDKAGQIMQELSRRYGGNMNQLNPIIQAIWGTQGGRVASTLMNPGSIEQWNNIKKATASTATVNQMQAQTNDTLPMQWKQFKSTLNDIAQAFGQQLIPNLKDVLHWMNDLASKFLDFELAHPKVIKFFADFGMVLGGMAIVGGPIVTFIGAIGMAKKAIELVTGATKAWEVVQWLLNAAMDANPIGLIILAVAALTAGVIWCYQNWDLVKSAMARVWDMFKNNPILIFLGGPITMLIAAISGIITNWSYLVERFQDGWATVQNAFTTGVNAVIPYINKLIDAWDYVTGMNVQHLSGIGGVVMTDAKANAQQLTNNQAMRSFGMSKHALGGIFTTPHVGMVAEAGAEAIIPLTNRSRGTALWHQAGEALGLTPNSGGNTYIEITINPSPYQDPSAIADEVIRRIERDTVTRSRSSGYSVNLASMR